MRFTVDPASPLPMYAQLVAQVQRAIATGALVDGDALPSIREVATRLRINHLTVKKAYDDLQAQGIVRVEQGRGTFVTREAAVQDDTFRLAALAQAVDALLAEARSLNYGTEEVIALMRARQAAGVEAVEG